MIAGNTASTKTTPSLPKTTYKRILPTTESAQDNLISIASDMAPEAIEESSDEKQNSDEERDDDKKPVIVDVVEGEVHDLDEQNETNGGKGEKRSNGVVASAGDDWDAKRQRTGTDAEDAEAVGGEVRMTGDEKAVDGEDAEAVADAVTVDGEGREKDEPPVMVGDAKDADDNDRKRSRTEKDGMGAPNGSVRPVARVLFGTIGDGWRCKSPTIEFFNDVLCCSYFCFSLIGANETCFVCGCFELCGTRIDVLCHHSIDS